MLGFNTLETSFSPPQVVFLNAFIKLRKNAAFVKRYFGLLDGRYDTVRGVDSLNEGENVRLLHGRDKLFTSTCYLFECVKRRDAAWVQGYFVLRMEDMTQSRAMVRRTRDRMLGVSRSRLARHPRTLSVNASRSGFGARVSYFSGWKLQQFGTLVR